MKKIILAMVMLLFALGGTAWANGGRPLPPADDPLYLQECGSCHWAFLPGLAPAQTWHKIMNGLENHFGDDASLDKKDETRIRAYLRDNSAETTMAKGSRKILRSLRGREAPDRVTHLPYLVREHDEIPRDVFARKDIRTFSNCAACHPNAARGSFREEDVRIPGAGSTSSYERWEEGEEEEYRGRRDRSYEGRTMISLGEAIRIATSEFPGDVLETERERGRYEIKIRTSHGERIEVYIDGYTGEILRRERKGSLYGDDE